MAKQPLVTLIVPCYNVAGVCEPFFESLLRQTYTRIQLILVDDGSTDDTATKVQSYIPALEALGYECEHIFQENRGLGGAINAGLKRVRGEYLCWADPDDYYEDNAFELRVAYMLEHPECAALDCDAYLRPRGNEDRYSLEAANLIHNNERQQFLNLLRRECIFCPGCHMVATWALRDVNPEMDIYEARRGQNWQLLLPVYYKYERHFLPVPLYDYISSPGSMSHDDGYEQQVARLDEHDVIISETLKRINMPQDERDKWLEYSRVYTVRLKMYAAASNKCKKDFRARYRELAIAHDLTFKDRLRWVKVMAGL